MSSSLLERANSIFIRSSKSRKTSVDFLFTASPLPTTLVQPRPSPSRHLSGSIVLTSVSQSISVLPSVAVPTSPDSVRSSRVKSISSSIAMSSVHDQLSQSMTIRLSHVDIASQLTSEVISSSATIKLSSAAAASFSSSVSGVYMQSSQARSNSVLLSSGSHVTLSSVFHSDSIDLSQLMSISRSILDQSQSLSVSKVQSSVNLTRSTTIFPTSNEPIPNQSSVIQNTSITASISVSPIQQSTSPYMSGSHGIIQPSPSLFATSSASQLEHSGWKRPK